MRVDSRCAVLCLPPLFSRRLFFVVRVRSPTETLLLLRVTPDARLGLPGDQAIERELPLGVGGPAEGGLARLVRLVRRRRGPREAGLAELLLEAIVEGLVLRVVGELFKDFLRRCW